MTRTTLLLEQAGMQVTRSADGFPALEKFAAEEFDLVVLELMLPSINGLEVCREIRRKSEVPIMTLAVEADPGEVVDGLEAGADHYVTKPFNTSEFLARVGAALRRSVRDEARPVLRFGSLDIDSASCRVTDDGHAVELSVTEFRLLLELALHPDRVLTREELVERVWGYRYLGASRLVDMAVKRLRGKIRDDAREPRYIATVRGIGYRFTV